MRRRDVFREFREFVQKKDTRNMDDICNAGSEEFQLQVQQKFLREYMRKHPQWDRMMLYHQIGSGKTCTAITMAEEYLRAHPGNKVRVILPARLKTNFIDELISPCGMGVYISEADYNEYMSNDTSAYKKARLKTKFISAINERYDIMSFEKFKIEALRFADQIDKFMERFSQKSLVLVDEVHNLLSDKYDAKALDLAHAEHTVKKGTKGMATILFHCLTRFAHSSTKFVLLTATPVFDNVAQIKEIVMALNRNIGPNDIPKGSTILDMVPHLKGRVSYFPGTSPNAYPRVERDIHEIPLTKIQELKTIDVKSKEPGDEDSDAYMAKERQISLSSMEPIEKVVSEPKRYAPKLVECIKEIKKNVGKHLVYSGFIENGLKPLALLLEKEGWINLTQALKDPELAKTHKGKVYAVWDGSLKDTDKLKFKSIINAKDNLFGERVRVILGSPSIKEGISFKCVQHMHLLDPVWNQSAKTQIEGRVIRYCSHVDIQKEHMAKGLARQVIVHEYRSVVPEGSTLDKTVDEHIYKKIIPRKQKFVSIAEKILRDVAIDKYLFKNMYTEKQDKSRKTSHSSSDLQLEEGENIRINKKANKQAARCPKARRPPCPEGSEARPNKQGEECCYKIRRAKK